MGLGTKVFQRKGKVVFFSKVHLSDLEIATVILSLTCCRFQFLLDFEAYSI